MKGKIKYQLLLITFLALMVTVLFLFHDWIEQNSNSLMVLITFVYVVATIEICRANINSAEASKEQLEESKREFEETRRLNVIPFLQIEIEDATMHEDDQVISPLLLVSLAEVPEQKKLTRYLNLRIKNNGYGLAYNIHCSYFSNDEMPKQYPVSIGISEEKQYNALFQMSDDCSCSRRVDFCTTIFFFDLLGNKYSQQLQLLFAVDTVSKAEPFLQFIGSGLGSPILEKSNQEK